MITHPVHRHGAGFRHAAVVAASRSDAADALNAELRRSAAAYDEILLVVSDQIRALLTAPAGRLGDVLRFEDPAAFYLRLGFAYEGFRRYLADQHAAGRRVHVIAEPDTAVDAGPRADRTVAYLDYEAMCNDSYAPYDCAVTCLWTGTHHPAHILDGARATHPYLLTAAGLHPSPSYLPPERYLADRPVAPAGPAPAHTDHDVVLREVGDLSRVRATLTTWAAACDFAGDPADDLVVASIEVATNGLRHGAAPVRVRAWREHSTLVVQCDDSAGHLIPATAGYRRPRPADALPGGRGLWLARQLADIVLIDSVRGRTSVRLYFPHDVMHR